MGEYSEPETPVLQEKLDSSTLEEPFVGEKPYDPEFERLVLYPNMKPGENPDAMMERVAKATTKDVIDLMGLRLTMPEKDHVVLLLWMCQSYLRGVLPDNQCVHLFLKGTTGTGKTEVLRMCENVCYEARLIGSITPSALKRAEGIGTLLIDEVEVNSKDIDNELFKTLRQSESWKGLPYVYSDRDDKGKMARQETAFGGPIAFSARDLDDDALKARALTISMRKATFEESHQGRQFNVRTKNRLSYDGPIRDFVKVRSERIRARGLTQEQVLAHMTSRGMGDRIAKFRDMMPRRFSQASLMLTVNDLFDLGIEEYLADILTDQPDEEQWDLEKELLVQALSESSDFESVRKGERWVPQSEVLSAMNLKLKAMSYHPMRRGKFDRFLSDVGFVRDVNRTKRSDYRGNVCLKFDATVRMNIGLDKPVQNVLPDDSETPDATVTKAIALAGKGVPSEEIEREVGPGVLKHCLERGLIPKIGGRGN